MLRIQTVSLANLDQLVPLFDEYRIFYKQDSDIERAYSFLRDRISQKESVLFLAYIDDVAVGFKQLFFSFSSVHLKSSLILNDLYVSEAFRNKHVATSLLEKAKSYSSTHNYKGLALETAIDNPAQMLYEKLGWKKDTDCFHYFWKSN